MNGQKIGYIRVSSLDQNTSRQLEELILDKIFTDKISGKSIDRPELKKMMDFIREGDAVYVHSMDRLARNLIDLQEIVKTLTERKISIHFIKEALTFTGEEKPISILLLQVMGAVAQFERAIINERQREGIALAKQRGVYKGRKNKLTAEQIIELKKEATPKSNKSELARKFDISRDTLYKYIKEY